jgi:folate-binding Fe-S cluster repair protein YgfZ
MNINYVYNETKHSGRDAMELVQSLSTNDVGLLGPSQLSQYSIFLAPKGRVLTEVIVHYLAPDRLLLDCSLDTLSALGKHLVSSIFVTKQRLDVT